MPFTPSNASAKKQSSLSKESTRSNHDHQIPQSADKNKVNHGKNILLYSMLSGLAMVTTLLLMTGNPEVEKEQYEEVKTVKRSNPSVIGKAEISYVKSTSIKQNPGQFSPKEYNTVPVSTNTALMHKSNYSPVKLVTTEQTEQQVINQYEIQHHKVLASIENQNFKRQQDYKKSRQLQQQRQQINFLIRNARTFLRRTPLSHASLNEALVIHNKLTSMVQQDSRVIHLHQQIIAAYEEFALYQKDTEKYQDALSTVQHGLQLDKNNSRLLRIKEDIDALISVKGKELPQPQDTASL
ncbi:MAG: hypothetical protein GY744_16370 [Gammaproteobacteria bacterium]|nr:hypothetical protein [Gammaproteobacteria bacterium]